MNLDLLIQQATFPLTSKAGHWSSNDALGLCWKVGPGVGMQTDCGACRRQIGRMRICDHGGAQMPVCLALLRLPKGTPGRNVFSDLCQGVGLFSMSKSKLGDVLHKR